MITIIIYKKVEIESLKPKVAYILLEKMCKHVNINQGFGSCLEVGTCTSLVDWPIWDGKSATG
jgi:hypothetical protein